MVFATNCATTTADVATIKISSDATSTTMKVAIGGKYQSIQYSNIEDRYFHGNMQERCLDTAVRNLTDNRMRPYALIGEAGETTDATSTETKYVKLVSAADTLIGSGSSTSFAVNTIDNYLTTSSSSYEVNPAGSYAIPSGPLSQEELKKLKADEFRARLRSQMIITRKSRSLLGASEDTPEGRARALLREMVGDREFHRYLRRGCVTVVGKTGLRYEVYGDTIHVYARKTDGSMKKVESICLVFKNHASLPPTDHVIMRKLMIEADEFGMRTIGNRCSYVADVKDVDPKVRDVVKPEREGDGALYVAGGDLCVNVTTEIRAGDLIVA